MGDDSKYISKYVPGRLYVNPKANAGAYAAIAEENEVVIDEFEVGARFKLCVTAFFVSDRQDFSTFKIHKLQYQKRSGWFLVESVSFNAFQLEQIRRLVEVISSLDLSDASRARLDLGQISLERLSDLFESNKSNSLANALSQSPKLKQDIFALETKRIAITAFENMMQEDKSETEWQKFFENNHWIFGIGLNFVPMVSVGEKLEAATTGYAFNQSGKRADALMRTKAAVSQFVLAEIKKPTTKLLQNKPYRADCWAVSDEVAGAVSQSQKTVSKFSHGIFEEFLKDSDGNHIGEAAYSVQPKSFIVVGNLGQLVGNPEKIASFELFRKNTLSPEIVTYDELLSRARAIVGNISPKKPSLSEDEIPF